jgi:hypothetical protein
MEALAAEGAFKAPRLEDIERSVALSHAQRPGRGRIFVDLWNLERFAACPTCFDARLKRLHAINLTQQVIEAVDCAECGVGAVR